MTEQEMEEESTPQHAAELIPQTQLAVIIKESKLDKELAEEFFINFEEHFKMANEWSKKAKLIIVTNENQTVLMEQARVARLFIRSKRLEIENFRKSKKEYYLRGGQAVDKVATFLKNIIEPIENHLDLQEHYVEYKKKAEDTRLLEEARIKEDQRVAAELLVQAAERDRLKIENEKLRKESEEKERINQKELEIVHQRNEEILRIEREKNALMERELRNRKQAEMKAEADKIRAEEALKSASDVEKMKKFYEDLMAIQFPDVISPNAKRIIFDSKSHVGIAVMQTKNYIQSIVQEEEE